MVHGLDSVETETLAAVSPADAASLADRILGRVNQLIVLLSSVALVIAACVLTYSVASRYFFHFSTDWQDAIVLKRSMQRPSPFCCKATTACNGGKPLFLNSIDVC